jgi:hypothetical protein
MVDRLKRKAESHELKVTVPRPRVRVKAPDVSVDGLNVSIKGITVTVDSAAFASAIGALANEMARVVNLVATIQQENTGLTREVARLAGREMPALPAPVVNLAAPTAPGKRSAGGYDIVLVRDEVDNEILGMKLRPVPMG